MATAPIAYVKWAEEEAPAGAGSGRARAAWLVADVPGVFGERQQVLAYLGPRPAVTPYLEEELAALYPDVRFDWRAIRQALAASSGYAAAAALTDDELVLNLRALARERGLSLMDLGLRLGYRQRQVLPEVLALLEHAENVARFERTSGSIFDYMAEKHPEYAYLICKARLYFEGEEDGLQAAIAAEPPGFGDSAWRTRRRFWREQIDAHLRRRRSPPNDPGAGP